MELLKTLNSLLDSIDQPASNLPIIKRLIKSSRKQFRPRSPNDVYRLTYLSTLLYVAGNLSAAEVLLDFIDQNTGEYTDGRRDLAVELATSRLCWAYILRQKGEEQRYSELLTRPDIEASCNLENIEPEDLDFLVKAMSSNEHKNYEVGRNLVSDILLNQHISILDEERAEYNTASDKLKSCYHGFLELLVIRERSEEIRDRISIEDDLLLDEGIDRYLQKITYYLSL